MKKRVRPAKLMLGYSGYDQMHDGGIEKSRMLNVEYTFRRRTQKELKALYILPMTLRKAGFFHRDYRSKCHDNMGTKKDATTLSEA